MAKKKKNNKAYAFMATLFGIVAVAMLFLPVVGIKDTDTVYKGMDVAFGLKESVFGGTVEIFSFSFMNLLTYVLVIGGIVFAILGAMGKGSAFADFISFGAFVVGAVFFFMQVAFCIPNSGLESLVGFFGGDVKDSLTLAYGAIIGGVASALSALSFVAKKFLK